MIAGHPLSRSCGPFSGGPARPRDGPLRIRSGLRPLARKLGQRSLDLPPDPPERDAEHALAALQQVDHLVGARALVDAHAVAHQGDLGQVVDAAVAQVPYGGAYLLEGDARVQKTFDDLQDEDVAEAVQSLGPGSLGGPYRREHQFGPGPVVELPVGDPGRRARRGAAVSDALGQRRRLLVEQQTLFAGALARRLPNRVVLAGRLTLAAADRHCGPPAFSHPTV